VQSPFSFAEVAHLWSFLVVSIINVLRDTYHRRIHRDFPKEPGA
jgi:hypothetical protein